MEKLLNVNYIISLKRDEIGEFSLEDHVIPLPMIILQNLEKLQVNQNVDIFDVVGYVKTINSFERELYSYCWPHEYHDSFIKPASWHPLIYFSDNYKYIALDYKNDASWREAYEGHLHDIQLRVEYEYEEMIMAEKAKEIPNLAIIKNLEDEMCQKIDAEQKNYKIKIKDNYIDEIRRYIYAMCYTKTANKIKATSLMYSNDTIGWYNPIYKITDNVSISLKTNFCYGRSTYFFVFLSYKGIDILPYSEIVLYYWSHMMDHTKYTRAYIQERKSWCHALSFVSDISNLIVTDPHKFEEKWIVGEVETMMEGLSAIKDNTQKYYKEILLAKEKSGEIKTPSVDVRLVDNATIEKCRVYEYETLFIIQVDKMCAALSFIDDLSALRIVYANVLNHVGTIVKYCMDLIIPITHCIYNLAKKIDDLQLQLHELQKKELNAQTEIQKIKIKVNNCLEEADADYRKLPIGSIEKTNKMIVECEKDKVFLYWKGQLNEFRGLILKIQKEIDDRRNFSETLKQKKDFIVKATKDMHIN